MSNIDELIKGVNEADSAQKLFLAVSKLAQAKSPQAIPTLIEVLGFNNPGAAVSATEGLISLGESAVTPLLANIDDYNYGARAWMIRVFAGIGDPRALPLLIKASISDFSLSVRRAAAKGLGSLQWHKLPLSEREGAEKQVLDTLFTTIDDGEWVVRYASIVSLENLYKTINNSEWQEEIEQKLHTISKKDQEIALQCRASKALEFLHKTE
ncbi:MAG: HEAT repeat domain-containing protein [Cyanobacterium sp. T60_A2020_053]|nr:HEAT repeat domain-containing protein [Cyanobacterium sp. T60_A2020_053]